MKITFHGQSCFTIEHNGVRIITDPFDPDYTGLKLPVTIADFVTISHEHQDHNYRAGIKGSPMIFDWPGEYESKDVVFQGITAHHFSMEDGEEDTGEVTIFVFRFGDFSICHLGDLGHRMPTRLLEKIGEIDILLIPVGGNGTINAKKAEEVVSQIEPKVAIPMHYDLPGLKLSKKLDPVDNFLKEVGATGLTPLDVYEPKKAELTLDKTTFVVLNPKA